MAEETHLLHLINIQRGFIPLHSIKYKNEFETMRFLFDKMPSPIATISADINVRFLKDIENKEAIEFERSPKKDAKRLRQQGNELYTGKRNILGACRLYNDAIFSALETSNGELGLAFANRAAALQAYGYYQQAYDDCVYALRTGYPVKLRHKLVTRQAFCALQLKWIEELKMHLNELSDMSLNQNFTKDLEFLETGYKSLKDGNALAEFMKENESKIDMHRHTQEIVFSANERGRYMLAKSSINKNDLIFTERAPAVIPTTNFSHLICSQCCITNFIPYPCQTCRGRVVYCGLRCQEEHTAVHQYECSGYRIRLFSMVGQAHLALRTILDRGLFSVMDELRENKTTLDMWRSLNRNGDIWKNENIEYSSSLRMCSHLDKNNIADIFWNACVSYLLVCYLREYTTFFKSLSSIKEESAINWELLSGSLLLRHIGQTMCNASTQTVLFYKQINNASTIYHLLEERIWSKAYHLRAGYLHCFNNYEDIAAAHWPYLGLANHACIQSFQPKFSSRYISVFASKDHQKGDEITNCYILDYRKSKRSERQKTLQETYHFKCRCKACDRQQEDQIDKEYIKYHKYICDNIECGQIFTPKMPSDQTLEWWKADKLTSDRDIAVICTHCQTKQRFSWYYELKKLLFKVKDSKTRRDLYNIFNELENKLIGLNELRAYIAALLVTSFFKLHLNGACLEDSDYSEMLQMIKYMMDVDKDQCCLTSTEYVTNLTILWDLIALGKYKCNKSEMNEMLFAITIIPDDLRVIFLNYYEDYMRLLLV